MPGLSRRVVLTGVGVVTPIGLGFAPFTKALEAGRSGVKPIRGFDPSGLDVRIAAEVEGFDARDFLDRKERKSLKMMARTVQLAVAAARLAVADGKFDPAAADPARLGVVLGSSTVPGDLADLGPGAVRSLDPAGEQIDLRRWGGDGMPLLQPMWMLNHVPNMAACHVSILHNAQGPSNTITQSDVAGLLALSEAARLIDRGAADLVLAGGADARTAPIVLTRYSLFAQLSRRNAEPEKACRPFDRSRDGQVLGEGAGVLLVEGLEQALARQAPIRAEVVGFAAGFDRGKAGPGLARVVRQAMADAGVGPADLDHVNAHAPGTREEDAWEARGLREALGGGAAVPVLACKSFLGNLGAAGAAVELAVSLAAFASGRRPGTHNHEEADPGCPVEVATRPAAVSKPYVLKVSCTEMGQCAAMVVRRWP